MKNPDAHVRLHWRGWWNGELAFHEDALIHPFLAGGRKRARVCCCRCWQALGIDGALACRTRGPNCKRKEEWKKELSKKDEEAKES